jgi:predicted alpha/beta superfamily hydrolase
VSEDRIKDLTPNKSLFDFDNKIDSSFKTSGGNEQFFDFNQQELLPLMENKFKESPFPNEKRL